ncbi:hypothetical protein [Bacillus sp. V59.32b]|uniref:hypothetical protein n=1 Tax=Bacillus sp. V59.32b TaxID=1758642 RepID=UPI000E3E8ADC|nr:hypothetical protein [Bacillus sp. V59.32b]RFU70032.1 hypothetical protein D0463_00735 [Bacillus sp. V59.32b]
MYLSSLEERRIRNNEIKLVTEALYEANVKDDEILRVLMKVCNVDKENALVHWGQCDNWLCGESLGITMPSRRKITTVDTFKSTKELFEESKRILRLLDR